MDRHALHKLGILLGVLLLPGVFSTPPRAERFEEATQEEAAAVRQILNDLKAAIKERDFGRLKSDAGFPIEPLWWGSCESDHRVDLSRDAMLNELRLASEKKELLQNDRSERIANRVYIETKGWEEKRPYLYFVFKEHGEVWRWLGVFDCFRRSSDFLERQERDPFTGPITPTEAERDLDMNELKLRTLRMKLKNAIRAKDFSTLGALVPETKGYGWEQCGSAGADFEGLSFEDLSNQILRRSSDSAIITNANPDIRRGGNDIALEVTIETSGWRGRNSIIQFHFRLPKNGRLWEWTGACHSEKPLFKDTR